MSKYKLGDYTVKNWNSWDRVPRATVVGSYILTSVGATALAASTTASFIVGYLATTLITNWAMSALTPKPDSGASSSGQILSNAVNGIAPQDFVYGKVRKGGTITFYESSGDKNKYLHQIIVLAGHEVNSIGDIYINDQIATLSGDFVTTAGSGDDEVDWASKIRIKKYDGSQTTADSDLVSETSVDSNFKGLGISYLYVRYEYNQDVFPSGVPTITAVVEGKKVYDPRTTSTAYSNNAALCIRDFLTSSYGLDDSSIDDVSFAAAANECDETINLAGGGTENRYELNGIVQASRSVGDVLGDMVTSCAGSLFWGAGYWKLKAGAYSAPVKTLTLDDLRSPINLDTRITMRDNFNRVSGTFNDAAQNWITADYPQLTSTTNAGSFVTGDAYTITEVGNTNFTALGAASNTVGVTFTATGAGSGTGKASAFLGQDNGEEALLDLQLPFTTSASAAQRLAKLTLFRGREQMAFSADFGLEAFSVEVGDIIGFTNERYGFSAKEFEVIGWKFASNQDAGDLRITLTLRETSAAAFDWNAEETAITSNDTTLPSVSAGTNILGLSLADGGSEVQGDGTVENSLVASWTASTNSFVSYYEVEWGQTSSANRQSLTTSDNTVVLAPVIDGVEYTVRVRSVSVTGFRGAYASATATSGGDTTAPALPTSLTASGLMGGIDIEWVNPADADFSHVEIYESSDNTFGNASYVGRSSGSNFIRGNLDPNVTRYYWVRAVDFSGNPTTVAEAQFAGPQNATTKRITSADIGPAVIPYEALDTSLQTTITNKANTSDLADYVLQTTYDLSVDAVNELETSADNLAEKALELAVNVSGAQSTITDAGIVVNPTTGEVTIQAVTSLGDTVNQVQIDLDAAETAINLRATQTYVNDQIAAAVLDSADLASLSALIARVDDVELTIDGGGPVLDANQMATGETYTIYAVGTTDFTSFGADSNTVGHTFYATGAGTGTGKVQEAGDTARISLVASGTVFDVVDGKVKISDVTSDITVLQGQITTKASSSDLNAVSGRVTTAEQEIAAIDVASITQNLVDLQGVVDSQDDLSTLSLRDVLGRYRDREYLNADIAVVRTGLQADVNDQRVALATARTELGALIDDNSALIVSEQTARADADSALATSITTLTASVDSNLAAIVAEQTARADADSAIALDVTSLSATVGGIQTTIDGIETEVDANASAVSGLGTRVTTTEGNITSIAEDITNLQSSITTTDGNVTSNASAISGLQTSVSNLDGDITAVASDVTTLTTTVGTNTASISTVSSSVNGLEAKYGVEIDNNGNISGFQLLSGAGSPSAFNVRADQFNLFNSAGSAAGTPFSVFTSPRVIGGVTYPAGTYMDSVYVLNAVEADTVSSNYVYTGTLTAAQVNAVNISADELSTGTLTSATADPTGSKSGFKIDTQGRFVAGDAGAFIKFNGSGVTFKGAVAIGSVGLLPVVFEDNYEVFPSGNGATTLNVNATNEVEFYEGNGVISTDFTVLAGDHLIWTATVGSRVDSSWTATVKFNGTTIDTESYTGDGGSYINKVATVSGSASIGSNYTNPTINVSGSYAIGTGRFLQFRVRVFRG